MPTTQDKLRSAAMLGAAGGLRTFTPVATLALRGRVPLSADQRKVLIAAAVGELIGDKLPFVPARTTPVPYLGRVASGGLCGGLLAGAGGAATGAGAAALGTLLGYHGRRLLSRRRPPLRVALLEDALAIGLATLAVPRAAG